MSRGRLLGHEEKTLAGAGSVQSSALTATVPEARLQEGHAVRSCAEGTAPPPRMPRHIWERGSPLVVEVERHLDTPVKVSGTATRPAALPFSTPFSTEIINAPRYGKVKMPMLDLYGGTTDLKEHLGVYKAQMYA